MTHLNILIGYLQFRILKFCFEIYYSLISVSLDINTFDCIVYTDNLPSSDDIIKTGPGMLKILSTAEQRSLVEQYAELARCRALTLEAETEVVEARETANRTANILEEALGVGNTMFRYWLPEDGAASAATTPRGSELNGNNHDDGAQLRAQGMVMTAISMGPALKILRSRYTVEEKAAAEAEKRALEKEWALGRLKKREQVILGR